MTEERRFLDLKFSPASVIPGIRGYLWIRDIPGYRVLPDFCKKYHVEVEKKMVIQLIPVGLIISALGSVHKFLHKLDIKFQTGCISTLSPPGNNKYLEESVDNVKVKVLEMFTCLILIGKCADEH